MQANKTSLVDILANRQTGKQQKTNPGLCWFFSLYTHEYYVFDIFKYGN